jgi:hypothetical protein
MTDQATAALLVRIRPALGEARAALWARLLSPTCGECARRAGYTRDKRTYFGKEACANCGEVRFVSDADMWSVRYSARVWAPLRRVLEFAEMRKLTAADIAFLCTDDKSPPPGDHLMGDLRELVEVLGRGQALSMRMGDLAEVRAALGGEAVMALRRVSQALETMVERVDRMRLP